MKGQIILKVSLAAGLLLAGCSKKAETPPPTASAETAPSAPAAAPPPGADPAALMMQDMASSALQKKSYTEAVMTVIQMGQTPGMSPQQVLEYQNLRRKLQTDLAAAAASGDQKAQDAINLLRMASTGQRR